MLPPWQEAAEDSSLPPPPPPSFKQRNDVVLPACVGTEWRPWQLPASSASSKFSAPLPFRSSHHVI
eukprot:7616096-Prorocentrum_lima.AAC.1